MAATPDVMLPKFFVRAWGGLAAPGTVMQPALVNALPTLTPFERLALLQRLSISCSPTAEGEPLGAALLTALALLRSIAISMGTDAARDLRVATELPGIKDAALKAVDHGVAARGGAMLTSAEEAALEAALSKAEKATKDALGRL
jgi:hypothetical protein